MQTGFRGAHPVSTLLFYAVIFIVSLTAAHPLTLLTSLSCAFMYDLKLRGKNAVSFFIKVILPLTLLCALFNGFFNHSGNTVLFPLPAGKSFTLEAVVYGLIFALRADCMLIWLFSFNEVVTNDKIIFLFGRISPRIALILSMSLRFIPLLSEHSQDILMAEKGIGNATASKSLIKRMQSTSKRLSILISWSLERGMDTQHSMLARGYGLPHRTSYNNYTLRVRDMLLIAFSLLSAAAFFITQDTLTALYNPAIIIPFPGIKETAVSLIIALLMLSPLITDISEEKKWSISE